MKLSASRVALIIGAGLLLLGSPLAARQACGGVGRIHVHVPEGTLVTINGRATTTTGTERHFASVDLVPGHTYLYRVTARFGHGGAVREETKTVLLSSGSNAAITFDFRRDRETRASTPPPAQERAKADSVTVSRAILTALTASLRSEPSPKPATGDAQASETTKTEFTSQQSASGDSAKDPPPPHGVVLSGCWVSFHLTGKTGSVTYWWPYFKVVALGDYQLDSTKKYWLYWEAPTPHRVWAISIRRYHRPWGCCCCCCCWPCCWPCCCCYVLQRAVWFSDDDTATWHGYWWMDTAGH